MDAAAKVRRQTTLIFVILFSFLLPLSIIFSFGFGFFLLSVPLQSSPWLLESSFSARKN
jgi:hypothetical protein